MIKTRPAVVWSKNQKKNQKNHVHIFSSDLPFGLKGQTLRNGKTLNGEMSIMFSMKEPTERMWVLGGKEMGIVC